MKFRVVCNEGTIATGRLTVKMSVGEYVTVAVVGGMYRYCITQVQLNLVADVNDAVITYIVRKVENK